MERKYLLDEYDHIPEDIDEETLVKTYNADTGRIKELTMKKIAAQTAEIVHPAEKKKPKRKIVTYLFAAAVMAALISTFTIMASGSTKVKSGTDDKLTDKDMNLVDKETSYTEIKDPVLETLMDDAEMDECHSEVEFYEMIKESGEYEKDDINELAISLYEKRKDEIEKDPKNSSRLLTVEEWKEFITHHRICNAAHEKAVEQRNGSLIKLIKNAGYCDIDMKPDDLRDEDKRVDFFIGCCKIYKDESLDLNDYDKARIAKYLNDCYYFMPNYKEYTDSLQYVHDLIEQTVPLQYGKRDLKSLWEQVEKTSKHNFGK